MADSIPFNRPHRTGREAVLATEALTGDHWRGDGPFTRRASALVSAAVGGAPVLLTTSCTHALELLALLLGFGPDDEVIVPSFTFVSTPAAFALRGARVVFADVDPLTLNLDPASVAARITPRTRAIVAVHYAGVACDLDALAAFGIPVIEDNAHGLFGQWRGRPLGSFGQVATLSFHDTKNIACGEGGALVVNDRALLERAEILREKGTNRARFLRGQVDKYTWVAVGSSYLPSDILAAVLTAQLEGAAASQAARQQVWRRYHDELATWASRVGVQQPHLPDGAEHPAHMYWMRVRTPGQRERFLAHLAARGIGAAFHYQPLHLSEVGLRFGGALGDCPVTELAADTLFRLPLYADLTEAQVDRVIAAVLEFTP
ncbi:MAG: dTDP-4-amino-4,6-dideoxygalactose transaminase [Deltaproteobacteria bacterium]|nr:dTDP-4-amino-4,6-dideoxygalactose transaminase [Deltaproteobacteria bacterium]